jgi:hypothetical protein
MAAGNCLRDRAKGKVAPYQRYVAEARQIGSPVQLYQLTLPLFIPQKTPE